MDTPLTKFVANIKAADKLLRDNGDAAAADAVKVHTDALIALCGPDSDALDGIAICGAFWDASLAATRAFYDADEAIDDLATEAKMIAEAGGEGFELIEAYERVETQERAFLVARRSWHTYGHEAATVGS